MRHSESYLNQCFGRDKFRRGRIWVVFHSTTLGRYRLTLDETSSVFAVSLFGWLSKWATAQPQYSRHGDNDRYPFPVPLRVYDQTIQVLKSAVQKAKLGRAEELGALQPLDDQARQLERQAAGPTVAGTDCATAALPILWRPSVFGWEHGQTSAKIGHIGDR
jgi:hypothetical protein